MPQRRQTIKWKFDALDENLVGPDKRLKIPVSFQQLFNSLHQRTG